MQKYIRRAQEQEAMEMACELIHTSRAFCTMVCNRLEVISHEDIDTGSQPWIVPFVATAAAQAIRMYEQPNPGKSRMAIGNAIRMMCRATKSREGDHFQAAIGLRSLLEDFKPTLPDFAFDRHTSQGKRMGRGLEHFRDEGTKLVPPAEPDQWQDEAFRLWAVRDKAKAQGKQDAKADRRARELFE
jgi:hypothetical protein